MLWISVDAMGGDHAPRLVVDGALAAAREIELGILLVGDADLLEAELRRHADVAAARVRILPATGLVTMEESPVASLRRKPGASIKVATEAVARGEAAALFSAGHTGATVMAAYTGLGMLPGVDRPALAAAIPRPHCPAILLDVGASVECRPAHLVQFAVMGSVYARVAFGLAAPRVGLLSIGEEASKGNELTRDAHRLLRTSPVQFIGNVEARDVYSGKADVIVCDGFTGNIALKVSEGLVEVLAGFLSEDFRRRVDYSEYGGAPLLGLDGVAVVGHGRSSAKAIRNGIALAHRFAAEHFVARVQEEIASTAIPHS
jgi:glycerol-3-phosphate acyltransferase PlsX